MPYSATYLLPRVQALFFGGPSMSKGGHSVLGVANAFLARGVRDDAEITPMQLQKLCYLAHGFSLALFDEPLVKEPVEAWDWGPVFPELYDAVKHYGSRPVSEMIHRNNWALFDHIKGEIVEPDLSKREERLVEKVWDEYGEYEGFQLSALTHEDGSPWEKVYRPGVKNLRIPDGLIKAYFLEVTNADA